MKKTALKTALGVALGVASMHAFATTFNSGNVLTITQGTVNQTCVTTANGAQSCTINSVNGSWFGMDTNGNGAIANSEKTVMGQGVQGLVIGSTQNKGGYDTHSGSWTTVPGDVSNINAPWDFFGNTGKNFTNVAVTGNTTNGLNLSGWTVTWNGIPAINMGGVAWGTGYVNGMAKITWNGTYGAGYTLDYRATVPVGDPSGFGGVKYELHLVGTVTTGPAATAAPDLGPAPAPVPVPAAVWLFGSGLLGLVGIARRKKNA